MAMVCPWCHKSRMSFQSPLCPWCAHGVVGTLQGELCNNLGSLNTKNIFIFIFPKQLIFFPYYLDIYDYRKLSFISL